jgi:hypothetical protein
VTHDVFQQAKSTRSLSLLIRIASLLRTHARAVDFTCYLFPVPDFLMTNLGYSLNQHASQVCTIGDIAIHVSRLQGVTPHFHYEEQL